MNHRIRIFTLFWLTLFGQLLLWSAALAQPAEPRVTSTSSVLELSQIDLQVALTPHLQVLEDASNQLQLQDVQQPAWSSRFKHVPGAKDAHNFSYTRSSYWFRLQLRNTEPTPQQRLLEIANARLSSIHFYQPQADGSYSTIQTGLAQPFESHPYPNRYFVFPVEVPAHSEAVIYMRVQSVMPLLVPATMWQPDAFNIHNRNDYLVQWLYFGIALAMLLFNTLLLLTTRDTSYGWYISFVISSILTIASITGLGKEYLWQEVKFWSEIAFYANMSITVALLSQFTRITLQTWRLAPLMEKLLLCSITFHLFFPILLFWQYSLFAKSAGIFFAIGALFCLTAACISTYRRQRIGFIFLLAFCTVIIAGFVTTLRGLGLLPTNAFTANGLQFGSALEMILLAFLQADRFNQIRKEKAADQSALLQEQNRHLATLKENELQLEHRVSERTLELKNAHQEVLQAYETANQEREIAVLARKEAEFAKQQTEQALTDLQSAQLQLVQAEKMAALGLLVSNVAHEINSPNGAILSSNQTVADAMQATLRNLPRLLESLGQEHRTLFLHLLSQNQLSTTPINTREERQLTKQLTTFLENAGIEGAIRKARLIVKLRAHTNASAYMPLLSSPDCDFILSVASGVSDVLSGTSNIHSASAKIARIVASLKELSGGERTLSMFENHVYQIMEKAIASHEGKLLDMDVVRNYQDMAPCQCQFKFDTVFVILPI